MCSDAHARVEPILRAIHDVGRAQTWPKLCMTHRLSRLYLENTNLFSRLYLENTNLFARLSFDKHKPLLKTAATAETAETDETAELKRLQRLPNVQRRMRLQSLTD